MVALDTFLPVIYTHLVKPGKLTWAEIIKACCINPSDIVTPYDQEEGTPLAAPLLLFNPEEEFTVTQATMNCGTLNTPLLGQQLTGSITLPIC